VSWPLEVRVAVSWMVCIVVLLLQDALIVRIIPFRVKQMYPDTEPP